MLRRKQRILPLLNIHGEWFSGRLYPDLLKVAMMDGRVIPYRIETRAAGIHTGKTGWEVTGHKVTGYQWRGTKKPPKRVTGSDRRRLLPVR